MQLPQTITITEHGNIADLSEAAKTLRAKIAVTADPTRLDDLRAALDGSSIKTTTKPQTLIETTKQPVN